MFKLMRAVSRSGDPTIASKAAAMGGGGSINYTMFHESSAWLKAHLGNSIGYWEELKEEVTARFQREAPSVESFSPITQLIVDATMASDYKINNFNTGGVPNMRPEGPNEQSGLLHLFPTQFNRFGQRTHSGVSLVDWTDASIEIRTRCRVDSLLWESATEPALGKVGDEESEGRCVGVTVQNISTDSTAPATDLENIYLSPLGSGLKGKVILCAGAGGTPQLLWKYKEQLGSGQIGQYMNDHVLLPFGLYAPKSGLEITGRDVYVPVFATKVFKAEDIMSSDDADVDTNDSIVCYDFFSG
ncbi:unnamed protein product, partial [Choristocarpus tenellus]